VLSGNTFTDTIIRRNICAEPTTTQTISVDCATLTQSIIVDAGNGSLTYSVISGNLCQ
jgi:hypothetical protein